MSDFVRVSAIVVYLDRATLFGAASRCNLEVNRCNLAGARLCDGHRLNLGWSFLLYFVTLE